MITAIDTNILLDVFTDSPEYAEESSDKLRDAYNKGSIIVCPVVYAELSFAFTSQESIDSALAQLNIKISPFSTKSLYRSGQIMKKYKSKGGHRERVVPDFMIGAHAIEHAEALLTRDRGFYRDYFKGLKII